MSNCTAELHKNYITQVCINIDAAAKFINTVVVRIVGSGIGIVFGDLMIGYVGNLSLRNQELQFHVQFLVLLHEKLLHCFGR